MHIVVRAIEDVFDAYDQKPTKRRAIRSLSYCKDEVEAQHEEWLTAQTGKSKTVEDGGESGFGEEKGDSLSSAAIDEHFLRILAEFAAAKDRFEVETCVRLEVIEQSLRVLETKKLFAERLEEELEELEKKVDEILLDSNFAATLTDALSNKMAEYKPKMEAEAYDRTFKLMMLKELRDDTGIPRFSLFYL